MVSLPSFLPMGTIPFESEVHALKTMKGHLSAYLRMIWPVCQAAGELPCPEDAVGMSKCEKWGEVIYHNALVVAMVSKNLELLTNELREAQGKKPLDYSASPAAIVMDDWKELYKETAEEMGYSVTDEGKLVRS